MTLTKQLLNEYSNLLQEMDEIDRKIEYYTKVVYKSEHGVVRGSMKDYPYAEKHFVLSGSNIKSDEERHTKIKQLLIALNEKRQRYNDLVVDIGIALELIDDSEMSTILFKKYVENKTDAEISAEMGYERSTITKKLNNFFKKQSDFT